MPTCRGSVADTTRLSAACVRGGGANAPSALSRSPTPKFLSALPKKIGVMWPSANARGVEPLAGMTHQIKLAGERRRVEIGVQSAAISAIVISRSLPAEPASPSSSRTPPDLYVDGADEIASTPDRPCDRRGVERQRLFDLVDQIERVAAFTIHLVDESNDRNIAQPAHLEQLARPRLDALGGIDHHDGGVDRRERPVGVFRKILVAGGIEQIEYPAAVLEGHDRSHDRNTALAFDRHPVGTGRTPVPLGLDLPASWIAPRTQQLLGQVVLPASGWEMIAKVRRRSTSAAMGDGAGAASRCGGAYSWCSGCGSSAIPFKARPGSKPAGPEEYGSFRVGAGQLFAADLKLEPLFLGRGDPCWRSPSATVSFLEGGSVARI